MVVLHICPLHGDMCSGVEVAVPQHVAAQQRYADAALWNLAQPVEYEGIKAFSAQNLGELPAPYRRPDIAVFHEVYIPRYPMLAKQLKKQGIPYVIMPHGSLKRSAQSKSRLKKAVANLLLFRGFCNRAAGIQCLTAQEKSESVMGRNIFVAPNGVDPPEAVKTDFHTDRTSFVYVGRILPHIKGLDLMIRAFSLEKEFLMRHGCTLDIYGPFEDRGYSYRPEMEELLQKEDAAELVRLHDSVTGDEKSRVLLDADVFIQTSRTEGMPMGVLEAFAYGLPCLLTEGTTFAETVSENGAGWNGGSSAETIAAALVKAVEDRERLREFSENALKLSENYSWNSAAETAVKKYNSIIRG